MSAQPPLYLSVTFTSAPLRASGSLFVSYEITHILKSPMKGQSKSIMAIFPQLDPPWSPTKHCLMSHIFSCHGCYCCYFVHLVKAPNKGTLEKLSYDYTHAISKSLEMSAINPLFIPLRFILFSRCFASLCPFRVWQID